MDVFWISSFLKTVSSPSWFTFWEMFELASILVVIVACWGEGWADHHKFPDEFASPRPSKLKKDIWIKRFWRLLIIGLAGEMVAFVFSFIASNREIEELRSTNNMLALAQKPRWQRFNGNAFIRTIAGGPKTNIEILYASDENSAVFATSTKKVLDDCGWNVIACREFSEMDAIGGWEKGSALAPPALSTRVGALWGGFGFIFKFPPDSANHFETNTPWGILRAALSNADMPFHDSQAYVLGNSKMSNGLMRLIIPPNQ